MSTSHLSRHRTASSAEADVLLVEDDGARAVALRRIRADYHEMPGLRLTVNQGARLWHLPAEQCEALLNELVASAFLVRSDDHYRLR